MSPSRAIAWEVLKPRDPVLSQVRGIYESTLEPSERIPWEWIARVPERRQTWRPGQWSPHLLVAGDEVGADPVGFIHGAHVPHFGGYVCYLGVDPIARGRGVAALLFDRIFGAFRADAEAEGKPLEFSLWESHRPGPDAGDAEWDNWAARCRLFGKVGGYWVEGVSLLTPSFDSDDRACGKPVPLELFLKPEALPATAFTPARLRRIAGALLTDVYGVRPGDALFEASLPPDVRPRLRPAGAADAVSLV